VYMNSYSHPGFQKLPNELLLRNKTAKSAYDA
jgi:hypothetical protein